MRTRTVAVLGLLGTALAAQASAEELSIRFEDVTARTGISFSPTHGTPRRDYLCEINGSGVALFDADGDGDLDIHFPNGAKIEPEPGDQIVPRDALYRNDGGWRFRDVTAESGLGDSEWSFASVAADVDNDGDQDLFVANLGADALYLNQGRGQFRRAEGSGVEDTGWSAGATFLDANRDGLLDLFVTRYLVFDRAATPRRGDDPRRTYKGFPTFAGPAGLPAARCSLYVNAGGGRFREESHAWGLLDLPPSPSLGVLALDANRDGWPDLFVANDTQANFLLLNESGRRFLDAGLFLGVAYNESGTPQASMGVAAGDARNVGRDDLVVTNYEDDTNAYHRAEADGSFTDLSWASGIGESSYRALGWGVFFFDADLDGRLDLFVANGHLHPDADRMRSSPGWGQRCHLFLGDGAGRFGEVGERAGEALGVKRSWRGAACGDLDGDGDADVVVTALDARVLLLENRGRGVDGRPEAAWVAVGLRGTRSNRDAIGARVFLQAGGVTRSHLVRSGSGYASQNEVAARFGLGALDRIEALVVEWPSGLREEFPQPRLRSVTTLEEGRGRASPAPRPEESRR